MAGSVTSYGALGSSSSNTYVERRYCTTMGKAVFCAAFLSIPVGIILILTGKIIDVSNPGSASSTSCYVIGVTLLISGCAFFGIIKACETGNTNALGTNLANAARFC